MAEDTDILLAKYQEHKSQARQHENLREKSTNFIIAIAGGLLAFTANQANHEVRVAAGVFILALGTFGAVLCYKHYERFRYHSRFAREADQQLREIHPASNLKNATEVRDEHKSKFGAIAGTRLHLLWVGIHIVVALLGVFLALYGLCT